MSNPRLYDISTAENLLGPAGFCISNAECPLPPPPLKFIDQVDFLCHTFAVD